MYILSILIYGNDDVTAIGTAYLVIYTFMQIVGLFVIHIRLVSFSKRMHAPNKYLMKINYRFAKTGKNYLVLKLKMVHCLMAMSSKKLYGITYDKLGLVTMATFAKFLLVYAKFMMMSYKITVYDNQQK